MRLKEFLQDDVVLILLEGMAFEDAVKNSNKIDEGIMDVVNITTSNIKSMLSKLGIHVDTNSRGILQYLAKSSVGMSKMMYYAYKAYYNKDEDSKQALKDVIGSMKKEDVMDFFLKLDSMTMHVVSGPIHMIDAVAGLHIWANVQKKMLPVIQRIEAAIKTIESLKDTVDDKAKTQIQNYANGLRRIFELEGMKMSEETIGVDIALPDDKASMTRRNDKKKKRKNKLTDDPWTVIIK